MTDRVSALTVVLKDDVRIDDVQGLIDAISRFNGVISVAPYVTGVCDHVAEMRARHEMREAILKVLK